MKFVREAEIALRAVSHGGEMIQDRPDAIAVSKKGSLRDVVTDFDRRVERYITRELAATAYAVVGEESFAGDAADPRAPFWLVDPIDGTANFISGFPFYGVSVGLCDYSGAEDRYLIGALSFPASKELYFTHGDQAAYLNGRPLRAEAKLAAKDSLVNFSFGGAESESSREAQYSLFGRVNRESRGALRIGSAAAGICNVAAGRLQAAVGIRNKGWDVAGAFAVARAAGCELRTWRAKNSSRISFVVGNSANLDEFAQAVERAGVL